MILSLVFFLFGVIGSQGLVEDLVVDLFQILVAKTTFCSERLRSTFAAEKFRLLCLILPRPVIPDTVVAIKSPSLFYHPGLLQVPSYHSPRKATLFVPFSGEKGTPLTFTPPPRWGWQYESAFARSRGERRSCRLLRFSVTSGRLRLGIWLRRLRAAPKEYNGNAKGLFVSLYQQFSLAIHAIFLYNLTRSSKLYQTHYYDRRNT